jgi:hypothetical protein
MYQGNDPGLDWECLEIFDEEGIEWYLYRKEVINDGWQNLKLVSQGRAPRKANYWFGWNGSKMNNGRDWGTLGEHRPGLKSRVLGYLKQA